MVPNVIGHVRDSIKQKLGDFLNSSYIINVVLGEMESDVRSSFISKYVSTYDDNGNRTKDGQPINVLTNYPEDIANMTNPFIMVGLGDGKESTDSIGSNSGSYKFKGGNDYIHEVSKIIRVDRTTIGLYISKTPAIETISIPNFTITDSTNITLVGNVLQIGNISPDMLDNIDYDKDTLDISYEEIVESNNYGTSYGYMINETVSILIVSKNLDEIRALDSILKAIFIILRQEDDEMTYYHLGHLSFNAPAPLDDTSPNLGNITFAREVIVEYQVDYGMDNRSLQEIEKILIEIPKQDNKKGYKK